ncbi:MAG: homoserine O-acetyltransferase, partial [Afipia sp.]|nr:homoserine O-acetyltransferase [Afipia sp.]
MSDVASRQPVGKKTTVSEERAREADHPSSQLVVFGADKPLHLDCGVDLSPFQIAYQSYGTLNADRSNAILICHALTGDQHVFNTHPVTGKPGWWQTLVGPGKP